MEASLQRCEKFELEKGEAPPPPRETSSIEELRTGSMDLPNTAFFDNFQNDFGTGNSKA